MSENGKNGENSQSNHRDRTPTEVEVIADLEERGFEECGLMCPECGTELLERCSAFRSSDLSEDYDFIEIERVCPSCGNTTVSYD